MHEAYDRAAAFVRERGDELDNMRLDTLVRDGKALSHEQVERFLLGQRTDGGWAPFWAPDYSSLDATCCRLAQGEGLIPLNTLAFRRAYDFFRSRQRPDGSWEEDESVRELAPPWATPGELAPRLYLTANCGWWLVNATLSGNIVTSDEAAQRAGEHLEHHLTLDGSLPSFLHAHWLAAGLWIRLGRNNLTDRALDYLTMRIDDTVPAGALTWMLTTLGGLGILPEHSLIRKATAQLMRQQRADGSWASEDGPDRDPYVTVEALRGLIMWSVM